MPVILSLQSGAALARSSNLISETVEAGSKDSLGRYQCLDTASVMPADEGAGMYDLGSPVPSASVTAITERDYFTQPNNGGSSIAVTERTMCANGGTYYHHQSGGWQQVQVPQGILVSSTALMSFAGNVTITEI